MRLKKINESHYVVVTDEPIKEGDWVLFEDREVIQVKFGSVDCKKITHSTDIDNNSVYYIPLSYVKKLLGEIDIEKKAEIEYEEAKGNGSEYASGAYGGYINGYNQCLEDNKNKRFSEEDLRKAFEYGKLAIIYNSRGQYTSQKEKEQAFEQLTQPKDTWECEFIDGQLKLK